MSAPWGKVSTPRVVQSLGDVMSEELAMQLAKEEGHIANPGLEQAAMAEAFLDDDPTQNDLLLAQMLQHEFDKENDKMLHKEEEKFNGNSRVRISYEKYRSVHPSLQDQEEDYNDLEDNEPYEIDFSVAGPATNIGKGKNMISKHDANVCGRRNTAKVDDHFPTDFPMGDSSKVKDMRLPNHVYTKLKKHAHAESKRSHRVNEKKDHATSDMVVDPKTRLLLYKLVNQGLLDQVNGVISSGKESVVYHSRGGVNQEVLMPAEVAIKVFKTTLAEFKNRCQYAKGDVRFFKDQFKKQNPRKIMQIWAEKESVNLKRMSNFGIPCPRVLLLKKHVLLLEFLGKNQVAAPKLKDAHLDTVEMQMAYEQVVQDLTRLYRDARLVHADLSEYNLLWFRDQVYFIDVAQTVDIMHPFAMEFLLRDCFNVIQFFSKNGVPTMTHYELFNTVTGKDFEGSGEDFLSQVEDYEKTTDFLQQATSKTNYPFDFFFELAQKKRDGASEEALPATYDAALNAGNSDSDEDEELDADNWEVIPSVVPIITHENITSEPDEGDFEVIKICKEEPGDT